MKRTIKVVALCLAILAFFIFVGSPFQSTADAIALESSVIAIIIAMLAAFGITITATGAFGDLETYLEELLQEYAESRHIPYSSLFTGLEAGSNRLGKLVVNNRFVVMVQGFAAWLISKFSLTDNRLVNINPTISLSGVSLFKTGVYYVLHDLSTDREFIVIGFYYRQNGYVTPDDVYYFFSEDNGTYKASLVSPSSYSGTMTIKFYDPNFDELSSRSSGRSINTLRGSLYYSSTVDIDYYPEDTIPFVGDNTALFAWEENAQFVESSSLQIQTGTILLPDDDSTYTEGDGAILDVGAAWGVDYGDITDDVLPETYEETDIEYVSEEEAAEEVVDTPAQTVSRNADDYRITGLQSVFPFCIPFDIYNFLSALAADPEAPSITARFYIPGICDEEIEIDLSAFDSVARILRTMELLAFCVGLAFETRKLIRG